MAVAAVAGCSCSSSSSSAVVAVVPGNRSSSHNNHSRNYGDDRSNINTHNCSNEHHVIMIMMCSCRHTSSSLKSICEAVLFISDIAKF